MNIAQFIKLAKVFLITLVILCITVGCASVTALKMAGPTHDDQIRPGAHRSEVESMLRVGSSSEFRQEGNTHVRYEYSDGPHQAWKLRILAYLAGDYFTLFISELVFWPIEMHATERIKRVGSFALSPHEVAGQFFERPGDFDWLGV